MKTLSADRCTVRCRVLKFDGAWKPLPFQVVDAPRAGNLCITDRRITCTAQSGTAPCAFVAPPLAFHTRVMIMFVDMIDTVNQTFRVSFQVELRLRGISTVEDPELIAQFLQVCGFSEEMLTINSVVAEAGARQIWTGVVPATCRTKTDFFVRLRTRVVVAKRVLLQEFPFDVQSLRLAFTLDMPEWRATLVINQEFPSLCHANNFHLESVWHVPLGTTLIGEAMKSDQCQSSSGLQYPMAAFELVLVRKSAFYISNVAAPMAGITMLAAVSIGTQGADASRLGTGDRLSITLTLLLTAVAYKFIVASLLPQVSYQTTLDQYILICFFFIFLVAIENVIWPAHGYDRTGGEVTERWNENKLTALFLATFVLTNLVLAIVVRVRIRRRDNRIQRACSQNMRLSKVQ